VLILDHEPRLSKESLAGLTQSFYGGGMVGAPFVRSGDRYRSQSEVRDRAARIAAGLHGLGVGHGDRYAIVLRNETAYLEATFAAAHIGAVPVPVNWHWTGEDLRHLLHDSGAKAAIVHSDLIPGVERHAPAGLTIVEAPVPPEIRSAYGLGEVPLTGRYSSLEALVENNEPIGASRVDPPMGVIYTSGTTGLAKGIQRAPVSAEAQRIMHALYQYLFGFQAGGATVAPAPLYHSGPNTHAAYAVATGVNLVIMPKFDPVRLLEIVQEHRVDVLNLVPTMFTRLLRLPRTVRDGYDLSSLRRLTHAAAPCPPDLKQAMIEWLGPIVWEYYGGTEGGVWVACDSEQALKHPGTVGRPVLDVDIRILDPNGTQLGPGETGVIYGRSFTGFPDFTYLGDEAKRRAIDRDGYITVGDVGHVDGEGFLYLSDRLNDMVISGGVNIYPAEIEACLLRMPGVADVAVFGIPDPEYGEALAAHLGLLPGATGVTEESVRSFVRENLAAYKAPRVVVFEERLPREDSGKLFKRRLRQPYWVHP
jgi:long-chain acyl-CoA synthetase